MVRPVLVLVPVLAAFVFVTACSKAPAPSQGKTASPTSATSGVPDSYWLAAAPAGAKPVGEVRKNAKTGDAVVVTGTVGGRKDPFIAGAAAFTIVDDGVKKCTPDECESPWDFCCEPPDSLTANSILVEIRDGKAPLRTGARGFHGLDNMKNVTVSGAAERDAAGNVIVVATGIHVAR